MSEVSHGYGSEQIRVLPFDEAVRHRPGMYFGLGPADPRLPTRILVAVLGHALHPAAAVAAPHVPQAHAEVHADLVFVVEDDQVAAGPASGPPAPGYFGSLLGPQRWLAAAAAVLSARTVVQVWRDGVGFRQELTRLRPAHPPQRYTGGTGTGTRLSFTLDPTYFPPGAAIARHIDPQDLHEPACGPLAAHGRPPIRDLRTPPPG
ncbi:hypothetical protein [Micromonospora auratinigra]|uniref:Uncharacterized protein n=1 Tax=Micromonospora auratinigra TaxID=261654 RepID=A0A1A8Z978_9ACTN|nr:hypothetical protein [Micromonospora auratinigra]SBT40384.1 hypothetical protein GA0070611_1244 [Micromonospora auratinigra]